MYHAAKAVGEKIGGDKGKETEETLINMFKIHSSETDLKEPIKNLKQVSRFLFILFSRIKFVSN